MRQQIPNIITLFNLFLGCMAIVSCFQFGTVASISETGDMLIEIPEKLYLASLFIGLAAVVDFLDGYVARLMNAPSEIYHTPVTWKIDNDKTKLWSKFPKELV